MRRSLIACGVVAIIGAAVAGSGYLVAGWRGDDDPRAAADSAPEAEQQPTFAAVTRGDLLREEEVDATTGFGDTTPLVLALAGTLTALPTPGDVIAPGDVVAAIDGHDVIAARGEVPMWRDLDGSVSDGADVAQVEQLLRTLGYAETYDVTVDDDWTGATTSAVRAFQEEHGQDDDGVINLGELVFLSGPVRVDTVAGVAGQPSSEAGITVSGTVPVVSFDLAADDSDLLATGDEVAVELPGGDEVPGTVTSIGAATADSSGAVTLPVEVTVDAETIAELTTGSAVTVHIPLVSATDVLSVPVEALLAVASGGFAVEVRDGATTQLVGVETGAFADGRVAITPTTGELADGDEVVVP